MVWVNDCGRGKLQNTLSQQKFFLFCKQYSILQTFNIITTDCDWYKGKNCRLWDHSGSTYHPPNHLPLRAFAQKRHPRSSDNRDRRRAQTGRKLSLRVGENPRVRYCSGLRRHHGALQRSQQRRGRLAHLLLVVSQFGGWSGNWLMRCPHLHYTVE